MPRPWKTGDVAELSWNNLAAAGGSEPKTETAIRGASGWVFDFGRYLSDVQIRDPKTAATVRPLVVIDPEDREQIERIRDYLDVECDWHGMSEDNTVENLQAALCSLLAPPKPPEPSGLGAVVEDADGQRWTLYTHPHSTAPWTDGGTSVEYDEISAVRVLSEGVTL